MSRIAKAPVELPQGVTATLAPNLVTIKGAKGSLTLPLSAGVSVVQNEKKLEINFSEPGLARTRAGATRAHLANMVRGVTRATRKSSSWSVSASVPRCRARISISRSVSRTR